MADNDGISPITVHCDCFGTDVKVRLMDATKKCVNEVRVGDRLMGFDNARVLILSVIADRAEILLPLNIQKSSHAYVSFSVLVRPAWAQSYGFKSLARPSSGKCIA